MNQARPLPLTNSAPQAPSLAFPPTRGEGHSVGGGKSASYLVSVRLKPDLPDSEGTRALWQLQTAGLAGARDVRISRLYELGGAFNLTHVQTAVRELLCDCVTQEFRIGAAAAASPNGGGLWRAEIWLKRGRTDAVGENLGRAMRELGIPEPITVRCGLVYHISGKLGRAQVEKAVARALANPVTQDFILSEGH